MQRSDDLRNVAIIAHVDHGKTTLVDAMLWQSGAFRANQDVDDRVMDSMDLEREKGITILAKNTAVRYGGRQAQHRRHARPRRLRRRGRARADDGRRRAAARRRVRGPAAADALRAAQGARGAAAGDPRRQQGRPAGRAHRRGRRRGLRAVPRPRRRRGPDRVPDRLHERARPAGPSLDRRRRGHGPAAAVGPAASSTSRRPSTSRTHPLQAHVTNLDASPYLGRLALCRVRNGTIRRGQPIAWCRADGTVDAARKVAELYVTEALDRVDADEAGPGEIIAVAGHARGDDRRDARRPRGPAAAAGDHASTSRRCRSPSAATPRRSPARTATS